MICSLKRKRLAAGMTQEQLSKAANVGRATISNIETDTYVPGVDIALMLAAALNCTVEDLFQIK